MNIRLTQVVLASLLGFSGVAQAEFLGGGPVYGGTASVGGAITCRIFNYGAFSVTVTTRQIWSNTNAIQPLVADSCNVAVPPGGYCAFQAAITGNLAFSCRLVATGTDVKLSGVAEVKNANNTILNSLPLQK
jgi:hypothetical protein